MVVTMTGDRQCGSEACVSLAGNWEARVLCAVCCEDVVVPQAIFRFQASACLLRCCPYRPTGCCPAGQ